MSRDITRDRVERILRRAADDVNATVVRPAVPAPVEDLDRATSRLGVVAASLILVAGAIAGVALVGGDSPPAPVAQPVPTAPPVGATDAPIDELACRSVVEIASLLSESPSSVAGWSAIGAQLDLFESQLDDLNLSEPVRRRYDRFVVLARDAVELGVAGGFTPAEMRADDAQAVARDLVAVVDIASCAFDESTTEPGGT